MRKLFVLGGAVAIAAVTWTQLRAQQEMLAKPGPGSGITRAAQHGDWQMAISNEPTVRVASITAGVPLRTPQFIRNRTYKVTWPNGDEEKVTIIAVPDVRPNDRGGDRLPERSADGSTDGWVQVQSSSGRRWINILAARAIEES
jgi:hypothetical protein